MLANGGVAAACALLALGSETALYKLAVVGAFAAAAADTVGGEVGRRWGRPTVLLTSLERVSPGTDGGISLVGSVAMLNARSSWRHEGGEDR